MARTYRMTLIHPETDTKIRVLFAWTPPSGDGWNEPRDPGGPEFLGAFRDDGSSLPTDLWEWADAEFAASHDEAERIVSDDDDRQREYAAEARADILREDR